MGVGVVLSRAGMIAATLSISFGRKGAPEPGGSGFWVPSGVDRDRSSTVSTSMRAGESSSIIILCFRGEFSWIALMMSRNSSSPEREPMNSFRFSKSFALLRACRTYWDSTLVSSTRFPVNWVAQYLVRLK